LQPIFYALRRLKITRKKTTFYKQRNAETRTAFIKKLETIPAKKSVYLDESGINQYLHRQQVRSARGKQVCGEISGKRFGRQSLISALQGKKLLAPASTNSQSNSRPGFDPR